MEVMYQNNLWNLEEKLGFDRLSSRRKEGGQRSFYHNEVVAHIIIPFLRIIGRV